MAQKKQRKCSICRIPGHTKRTCGSLSINSPRVGANSKKTKPSVIVRVKDNAGRSPHVVDLKTKNNKENWAEVEIFEEMDKYEAPMRCAIDLSEMVLYHNRREKTRWNEEMKRVKRVLIGKGKAKPILGPSSKLLNLFKDYRRKVPVKVVEISRPRKVSINFDFKFRKFSFAAIALFLVITLPLPAVGYFNHLKDVNTAVVRESTNGFLALQASTVAALNSNLNQAQTDLESALGAFAAANTLVEKEYHLLTSVAGLLPVVGTHIMSRQHLLTAGHHLALGNTYLVKGIDEAGAEGDALLTDRLSILRHHLRSALPQYQEAMNSLNKVEANALPSNYQSSFVEFKLLYGAFVGDLKDLVGLTGVFNKMFGSDGFKRYLLVFQNHHELRPTGGFVGSFAILDVQKGKIINIEVPGGGSYDLKGQLTEFVEPPLPLQLLNERWEFQDANWFPDFPASAEKLAWFYEHSRGASVDGVIAINASVLEDLLGVIGTIRNEEFDLLLDHENVLDSLQYEVEVYYDKEENQPKAVIASLLDQLLPILQSSSSTLTVRLLNLAHQAVENKEIQVYAKDDALQDSLRSFGWTGEIQRTLPNQDYLLGVYANIQGQKSDAVVAQTIEHQSNVLDDGSIINTVFVRRTHTGKPGEQFYGSANIGYFRLYVPEGAELLEAGGFAWPPEEAFRAPLPYALPDEHLTQYEKNLGIHAQSGTQISNQFDKTVFGNWIVTGPGETSEVYFKYKLPFKISPDTEASANFHEWRSVLDPDSKQELSSYSLLVQKQSGIESEFRSTIIYPNGWTPVWKSNSEIDLGINGGVYESRLNKDRAFGLIFSKQL